jgi:hypothetical protein
MFRAVLGRDVTKAEVQLIYELATTGESGSDRLTGKPIGGTAGTPRPCASA